MCMAGISLKFKLFLFHLAITFNGAIFNVKAALDGSENNL